MFFQAEDGIRDKLVTGVQTCALPISQIRQLEQAYGARLLDRTAKSVHLTPAGEVLFEYAERLLRLRDESVQAVADRSDRSEERRVGKECRSRWSPYH